MNIWNWWAFSAACAWILFETAAAPVYAAIVLSPSGYGTAAGFFIHSGAVKKAQLQASGIQKRREKAKRKIRKEILSYLVKHVKIERVFLTGVVSFEDCMHTALVWGTLNALSRISHERIQNKTKADFSIARTNIEITGILSVPAGHIMIAALKHTAIAVRERGKTWKNTRSKA